MKLPVYTPDGSEAGRQVELDDSVFGLEPNDHAIWLDVRAIQAHKRQGTHKTKERAEVSKSTRKLYRQKGTGNARAGSAKSPLRKGGGTIFGPRPHEYTLQVNRKTKQLARRSALAHKLNDGSLRIVEALQLDVPKTREVISMLKGNADGVRRVLVLTDGQDDLFYRSARNIQGVDVRDAAQASTLDLLSAHAIVLQEGAVDALTSALRPSAKTASSAPAPSDEPTTDATAADDSDAA